MSDNIKNRIFTQHKKGVAWVIGFSLFGFEVSLSIINLKKYFEDIPKSWDKENK